MPSVCCLGRRFATCHPTWQAPRRRQCVVLSASVGDEPRVETSPFSSPDTKKRPSATLSSSRGWSAEATAATPANNVVTALKANRGVRLIRAEGRKLKERRFLAFASAVALITLAWYGQDLISELGKITSLPVEELDGLIYFVICFNVVSFVLPKSRYDN